LLRLRVAALYSIFWVGCAQQAPLRNSITFSGGFGRDISRFNYPTQPTSLGVTYGYRILPYLAIEAGVTTAIHAAPDVRGASYDFVTNDAFIWAPFGVRGILPLAHGRVELSAAAGGLYEKYYVANEAFFHSHSGWGGYGGGSVAVALDPNRHFWIGASPRFYVANGSYVRDRWFVFTGDLGFRF
jgi:hypothetical protein